MPYFWLDICWIPVDSELILNPELIPLFQQLENKWGKFRNTAELLNSEVINSGTISQELCWIAHHCKFLKVHPLLSNTLYFK